MASVFGIEAATAEYACVWCKCPKSKRWDIDATWSFTDNAKGARTIKEIAEKSKLAKRNKNRLNCCHPPLFDFVPIQRVIIDSLHLFLTISDVLIRDLRISDGLEKTTGENSNIEVYRKFLNDKCSFRFQ